ncbi:MAG TPA: methyl-accepting chemotaxis protein [Lachnospiraceae bacterium]|nr:methyl-accepting chemotaxis protein [Lachnospiraceae bacterium]
MKSIFKPAIKLFNSLNLMFKFLLISIVLVSLLAISAIQYFQSVNSYITFNSKEIIGAEYAKESKNMMLNVLVLKDSISNDDRDLREEKAAVSKALEALEKLGNKYGEALDNHESGVKVSADIENCNVLWDQMKDSEAISENQFANLIEAIGTMHIDISDNSNLTLDPDIDTYYCMDVVMFRTLPLLSYLYDLKNEFVVNEMTTFDVENQTRIVELSTQINTLSETIRSDMLTAISFNNSKKDKSLSEMTYEVDRMSTLMEELHGKTESLNVQFDRNDLIERIDSCIEVNSSTYDVVNAKLLKMIGTRVEGYQSSKRNMIIILLIALPVLLYIYIAFMMSITDNIKTLNNVLAEMAAGELSKSVQIRSKDELGVLGKGINLMVSNLKGMIQNVQNTSERVRKTVEQVDDNIINFDHNINAVSGRIETLSGSTQELSASTEEIGATVDSLNETSLTMHARAKECYSIADEINTKTETTISSMNHAKEIIEHMLLQSESNLDKSIEAVKAVDKINLLSDAIMQITEQTNLLALNASIEAARAGVHGQGFQVVATEVRELAEESKRTATQIQAVVSDISTSVEALTLHSKSIMQFVKTNVIEEYNQVIEFGNRFGNDAINFKEFSMNVSEVSDTLAMSIQTLTTTLNEMIKANNYSAIDIQNVVSEILVLRNESGNIVEKMKRIAKEMVVLEEGSKRFKA